MNLTEQNRWFHTNAFHHAPVTIAVIDRNFNIVEANQSFSNKFGPWKDRLCYQTYKRCDEPCASCPAMATFQDGKPRTKEEVGVDREGKFCYYIVNTHAIKDEDGSISHVVEYSTDVTESSELHHAGRVLFDRAPCYVQILDRNLRVVLANEKQKETFGNGEGRFCYEVYKQRDRRCHHCPALLAFRDGHVHTAEHVGLSKDGERTRYIVTAAPLTQSDKEITHVIEMSMDITDLRRLERQLKKASALEESIISHSINGIMAFDENRRLSIFNPTAERILGCSAGEAFSGAIKSSMFPEAFQEILEGKREDCYFDETIVISSTGEKIPVRLSGVTFKSGDRPYGCAVFLQDLRNRKKLEAEKLEAERLGAVGETVAGLAHSVKNVLQALEGGMYAVRSGVERGNKERVQQGWPVLEKNFNKITRLVKDFLSFSKGRLPETQLLNVNDLAEEVVTLYQDVAEKHNVQLRCDLDPGMQPAPFDPSGIHTCLTNLLSNAIDACVMSEKPERSVSIQTRDSEGVIRIDVKDDGMGMEYEVKRRVFTTFFTTKGGGGTGLGLLTTRKIIQEHGGKISLDSEPSRGTVFHLEFPRNRLPALSKNDGGEL